MAGNGVNLLGFNAVSLQVLADKSNHLVLGAAGIFAVDLDQPGNQLNQLVFMLQNQFVQLFLCILIHRIRASFP